VSKWAKQPPVEKIDGCLFPRPKANLLPPILHWAIPPPFQAIAAYSFSVAAALRNYWSFTSFQPPDVKPISHILIQITALRHLEHVLGFPIGSMRVIHSVYQSTFILSFHSYNDPREALTGEDIARVFAILGVLYEQLSWWSGKLQSWMGKGRIDVNEPVIV
jgi:hypothetical protein